MTRVAAVAALIASLLGCSAARAEVVLCNDFGTRIYVALAHDEQNAVVSQGWWAIAPDACRTADFPFDGGALYYRAESAPYRQGPETVRHNWGNELRLFVADRPFRFDDAERRHHGARPEMFSRASVPSSQRARTVTMTLRFREGATTVNTKPAT